MTLEQQPEPSFTQTCRQGVQEGVAKQFKAAALAQAPRGEVDRQQPQLWQQEGDDGWNYLNMRVGRVWIRGTFLIEQVQGNPGFHVYQVNGKGFEFLGERSLFEAAESLTRGGVEAGPQS
jgi:hypothetical protein